MQTLENDTNCVEITIKSYNIKVYTRSVIVEVVTESIQNILL